MDLLRSIFICSCSMYIAGCGARHQTINAAPELARGHVVALSLNNSPTPDVPKDALASVPVIFRLQAYQLNVPWGTISRNEAFWKRIDEHCLDVAAEDNLLRNGIRVGIAPLSEWEYLNSLIQKNP